MSFFKKKTIATTGAVIAFAVAAVFGARTTPFGGENSNIIHADVPGSGGSAGSGPDGAGQGGPDACGCASGACASDGSSSNSGGEGDAT